MRKLLLTYFVLLSLAKLSAQVDIKLSPLLISGNIFLVSAEMELNDDMGLEANLQSITEDFFSTTIAYKYYLNPNYGTDRFYVGGFGGFAVFDDVAAPVLGFNFGYKIMSVKGFITEIGGGIGRNLLGDRNGLIPEIKLHFGYRLTGNKVKE